MFFKKDGKYINQYEQVEVSSSKLFRWMFGLYRDPDASSLQENKQLHMLPAQVSVNYDALFHPDPSVVQVTWIGHATFLIQLAGLNILTDPVFGRRASPFMWLGPKRYRHAPMQLSDLPSIDVVLISHNHYDHLEKGTIKALAQQGSEFLVPLGLRKWFTKRGVANVAELGWWLNVSRDGAQFHCVPAQHWSKRFMWGSRESLWSGWVIESQGQRVCFMGDTGYSPHGKEIGDKFGSIDLALIPIGAYRPREIMRTQHCNPVEAVQLHIDCQSRSSVGMHWGTFPMASEPVGEPPVYLRQALKQQGISDSEFDVMAIGETRVYLPVE